MGGVTPARQPARGQRYILSAIYCFSHFTSEDPSEARWLSPCRCCFDAVGRSNRLHSRIAQSEGQGNHRVRAAGRIGISKANCRCPRSEEHTSELQSRSDLVCRLLLEKKYE